jgi:hypothetical protein
MLRVHPEAEREWWRASRRYRDRAGVVVGERFDEAILTLLRRIEASPSAFPQHGLLAVKGKAGPLFREVRKATVPRTFPFVIFYYVHRGEPYVLAVAHAKRRPGYWAERGFQER